MKREKQLLRKVKKLRQEVKRLADFYNSQYFQSFQAGKLGNDLFINDPERAARIHDAAEYGGDGSTNAEVIEDWREALQAAQQDGKINDADFEAINREIDDCEAWHDKNGSLRQVIG